MNKSYALRLVRSRQKQKSDAEEQRAIKAAKITEMMARAQDLRDMAFRLGPPYGGREPDWVSDAIAKYDDAIRKLCS
jgi:hypothetical protein